MFSLLFAAASILGSPPNESSPSTNPSSTKDEAAGQSYQSQLHRRKRHRVTYEDLRHITSLHDTNDPQKQKLLRVMTRNLRRYNISFCDWSSSPLLPSRLPFLFASFYNVFIFDCCFVTVCRLVVFTYSSFTMNTATCVPTH